MITLIQDGGEVCGMAERWDHYSAAEFKAMGGENAAFGEVPWAVAIFKGREYKCTGALITRKHVVTVAHCFSRFMPLQKTCTMDAAYIEKEVQRNFVVWFGSNCLYRSDNDRCRGSPEMRQRNIVKSQYARFFESNCTVSDFALLELDKEIDNNFASHLCLPHLVLTALSDIQRLISWGWGSNPQTGIRVMNNIQVIMFPELYSKEQCDKIRKRVPLDVLCTKEYKERQMCLGDSGGGLTAQRRDGRWVLLGVISYGTNCADLLWNREPLAQTYTDLSQYTVDIDTFLMQKPLINDIIENMI